MARILLFSLTSGWIPRQNNNQNKKKRGIMARPLRIEYPNACYHVSNRTERSSGLFPGEPCQEAFLEGVRVSAERFNVEVLAWCLLRGEYHLLVRTPEANLSRFMRQVDGLYTQFFQRHRRSRGAVFRARYRSVLLQEDRWLAPVSRYIHNLPRASRQNPQTWRWSSLRHYLDGSEAEVPLLQTAVLERFAHSQGLDRASLGDEALRAAYGTWVRQGTDRELQHFYARHNRPSVLGDAKFKARLKAVDDVTALRSTRATVARRRPSVTQIIDVVARTFQVSDHSILRAARGPGTKNVPRWVAMYLCQEVGGVTLQKIADQFGLQRYGTVSTTIGKLKGEFQEDPPLQSRVQQLRRALYAPEQHAG